MARPSGDAWRSAWGIGFNFAAGMAGFVVLGYFIDRYRGRGHWGVLIGIFLGLVGGMYNMIRQALAASRAANREDKDAPPSTGKRTP